MKILLIGPPASGKGTLGKILSQEWNLPLINTGKLLREVSENSIWYQPVHDSMNNGLLAPNKIVGGLLKEYIEDSHYEKGYILDGWVRQLDDLESFDPQPDLVIFLNISEEVSKKRILNRRVCEKEGHVYNLISLPPKKEGICDIDGSKLIKREDDSLDVFEKRYEEFVSKTIPVVKYYKEKGKLIEINAEVTPSEVFKLVQAKVN